MFEFITFGALLLVFHAGAAGFQTGWFFVSLVTELLVVMVLRTRRLAWRSSPSRLLLLTIGIVFAVGLALPYSGPLAELLGFQRPSAGELIIQLGIICAYAVSTEALKHWFYRHLRRRPT